MSSNSINCNNFRAHHLRPDKCKNCFADRSRHAELSRSPTATTTTNAPADLQQSVQQQEKASYSNEHYNDFTRDQLIEELRKSRSEASDSNKCSPDIKELKDLNEKYKKEIDSLKAELLTVSSIKATNVSEKRCDECDRLTSELERLKCECVKLAGERDEAREELHNLEREMEELQDNFKEEESEQFEMVKQELDSALKNCKILQIRLNKADRQYSQLEQVKTLLERQLEESNVSSKAGQPDAAPTSAGFMQLDSESVKLATSEYDQLLRDLNDTVEREKDLQEQIKYSEEEAHLKSERLQAVEAENEVLQAKVNKLTLANSRLRSNSLRGSPSGETRDSAEGSNSQLIEQNEQLKLALEMAQSECERVKAKLQVSQVTLEARENALKESESRRVKAEADTRLRISRLKGSQELTNVNTQDSLEQQSELTRLQLECRQLRTRLVHSERQAKQLKAQLEMQFSNSRQTHRTGENSARTISSSQSFDSSASSSTEQTASRELNRKLRDQCADLTAQKDELERKLERLVIDKNVGSTLMESDLLEKLKRQLDSSESELAKTRSRLVEMDLENSRLQRQHKQLAESLNQTTNSDSNSEVSRRVKLPNEAQRDAMSRQELRQALKEVENELEETLVTLRAKNSLIREQRAASGEHRQFAKQSTLTPLQIPSSPSQQQPSPSSRSNSPSSPNPEEQLKSLRRLLDQERLLSNNLKIDVSNLEQSRQELQTNNRMYERERSAIEEEVDKLRQVNGELNVDLEELRKAHRVVSMRWKDLQVSHEKLRTELAQQKALAQQSAEMVAPSGSGEGDTCLSSPKTPGTSDMLLMARDLSELRVKNGFLMRQLEIAREDATRQLEDLRQANEAQQRRSIELAQLELKERHLAESQQMREELNELKQKLAASQRQVARHEEEMNGERDRLRSLERDWRRDKSQWQQRMEQLEAQLSIERRSNEFKVKECEAQVREKERALIGLQDRYVQLERDLQRSQNKYKLLEENSESKQKSLARELDVKKRELGELVARSQSREDEYYENCKRFNSEKTTLTEALESIRRSYDEKLAEVKSARELLSLRQDQAYKERSIAQERIDSLTGQLIKLGEHEAQSRLLKQQVQMVERQLESARRDSSLLKEERTRLKGRLEELEKRVAQYEKQELINKTSSISSTSGNLLFRKPFKKSSDTKTLDSKPESTVASSTEDHQEDKERSRDNALIVERLSSKINDQRHLINMLKQQHDETQLELKQLKLVQSVERNRWQSRVAQLTSQLNECEEKLLFESSLLTPETFENARRKLEVKWSDERRSANELLRQQQTQNDGLMRDLKKLTQAHDLLRLHSKQLEAHNNKLSRKLIEYQQSTPTATAMDSRRVQSVGPQSGNQKLFEEEREELMARQSRLLRTNNRLLRVMREEVQPLVETVAKIVSTIDESSTTKTVDGATPTPAASDADSRSSTRRPLVTAGSGPRPLGESDPIDPPDLIATARPAHLATQQQQPSRLSRFLLGGGTKQVTSNKEEEMPAITVAAGSDLTSTEKTGSAKAGKTVKRVKVKAASLGITPSEKRQLKRHLQELSSALEQLGGEQVVEFDSSSLPKKQITNRNNNINEQTSSSTSLRLRASSEAPATATSSVDDPKPEQRAMRAFSQSHQPPPTGDLLHSSVTSNYLQQQQQQRTGAAGHLANATSDSESPSVHSRVVRWKVSNDNSDLDSERSWSFSQQLDSSPATNPDLYRRFPRATPSNQAASLTDYGSDSSLASDFSFAIGKSPPVGGQRYVPGTESDSCLGGAGSADSRKQLKSKTNRKGLKVRLTNTWRNISRSITALATSDSEGEFDSPSAVVSSGRKQQQSGVIREARV